jgi:hypothetical protein
MKVIVNGEEYETSRDDWTFREEREVRRLTGLLPGDLTLADVLNGATLPILALAIVGHIRKKPHQPCDWLLDLKAGDDVTLDVTDEAAEPRPPARARKRAPKSPSKS